MNGSFDVVEAAEQVAAEYDADIYSDPGFALFDAYQRWMAEQPGWYARLVEEDEPLGYSPGRHWRNLLRVDPASVARFREEGAHCVSVGGTDG